MKLSQASPRGATEGRGKRKHSSWQPARRLLSPLRMAGTGAPVFSVTSVLQ